MLVVDDVVKTFRGKTAVDHASFKVKEGSFTALLGPNGSGKSTTLKMCTNLFQPDSGRILIGGVDVREDTVSALSGAGCVIETPETTPTSPAEGTWSIWRRLPAWARRSLLPRPKGCSA